MIRPRTANTILIVLLVALASAQTPEITTKDSQVTFKSGVNLVNVPVTVRDSHGRAVGDLSVNDFQIFDNGKLQTISKFRVEHLSEKPAGIASPTPEGPNSSAGSQTAPGASAIPDRFIAYVFDDVHMNLGELAPTRQAVRKRLDSQHPGSERTAIFSLSGSAMTEFTSDPEKLHAALDNLMPRGPSAGESEEPTSCPPVTYYEADQIINEHNPQTLESAALDALVCLHRHPLDGPLTNEEYQAAQGAARRALGLGERDSVTSFDGLSTAIGRMAVMPGQRLIVLVSNGFPILERDHEDVSGLIDSAIRTGVVVNTLDARGLYTASAAGEASERTLSLRNITQKTRDRVDGAEAQLALMSALADGTGGAFYHGLNDFDEGVARLAAAPDYMYVLSFNPAELKLDGKPHSLRVALKTRKGLSVEARKQYYAGAYGATSADQTKRQIEEAFFSREERHDAPAELQTQYFQGSNGKPTLSAVVRIDVSKLGFKREADRNQNSLVITTGVFDSDGNYVTGLQKTVSLRLQDATLRSLQASGLSVKSSFSVQPGRYLVRMVVRDAQDQLLSAESGQIEIP